MKAALKRILATLLTLAALVAAAVALRQDSTKASEQWLFLDAVTPAELGLEAHTPSSGQWALEDHEPATGGRALANHAGDPSAQPALLVARQPKARDVSARTRCKVAPARRDAPVEGPGEGEDFGVQEAPPARVHAACGIVFRFVDPGTYWFARADLTEGVVAVGVVQAGRERIVARKPIEPAIPVDAWIDLGIEARGDVVRVSLSGRPHLVGEAPSVPAAFGAVGLWAPAAATVFFDHFHIETLTPAPQALEILPILGRRQG